MANKVSGIALAAAAVAVLLAVASAQSTSGCSSAIVSLAPCLSYMTGSSSTPSSSCCSQLASVVKGEPQCLCALLNGGAASFGVTLNQTKALELPGACNVQTPPASLCNGPAKSPSPSPETPATTGTRAAPPPASTGSGQKATQPSGAISYKSSSSQLMGAILMVAALSFFIN